MDNKLNDILASWEAGRNVLLYGPPATGKTRLISELFQLLSVSPESTTGILLDPNETQVPFTRPEKEIAIPRPVKVVWTTFHQSYSYEDFVLGLRPEISPDGTRLQPWAGLFLDAALELNDPTSDYKSVVVFIDEINRGNAARIFGEFMTFLDFDYREEGRVALPLPLRQLNYKDGRSEKICRPNGRVTDIPEHFTFPKHIYIVSTMNSVDRAAIPIDSALSRRFDRIEMRPNLGVLARHWGLDRKAISSLTQDSWETLNPYVTGYLLMDRLNVAIASDLGPEFELGHGLFTSITASTTLTDDAEQLIDEDRAWQSLASAWDEVIFPQLEDRYSGRPEQLNELLHVDAAPSVGNYAWTLRTSQASSIVSRTLTPVRVSELEIDTIKRSFRWLTR
ncbi:AAA family ATPase [Enterobacter asburiae]|uniref:AAA family ATPase n=1 Tax=Enterobacter asburiae TaxID=61645 RepID=UPI00187F5013|nr:AAA family ATPase [Enterobacter asburiae]QOV78461.1 AAA family ATPase [Enterobacter asburiae]